MLKGVSVTVAGAVIVFAAAYVVMIAVNAGEVGAAWVQAVGGIISIWIAWHIASSQSRAVDEGARRSEEVIIEVVLAAGRRAFDEYLKLDLACGRSASLVPGGFSPDERLLQAAESALAIMQRFDVMKMPRPEMVQPFITLQRCLESLLRSRRLGAARYDDLAQEMYLQARKALDELKAACAL